jgi:hypothetical protein
MTTPFSNPDHNIWNNNGTYWCHYTIHDTPKTKQRIRVPLDTKDIEEARRRRDELMRAAAVAGTLARGRGQTISSPRPEGISESRAVRPRSVEAPPRQPTTPLPAAPPIPVRKPWWKSWIDAARSLLGRGQK